MNSIRRRLLFGLLAAVLCAGLAAAFGIYLQARREANELFDYQLRQMALSLRDQAFEQLAMSDPRQFDEGFDFVIQVWGSDGVRRYYSHPDADLPNRAQLGYETVGTPEGKWRVFSVQQRGLVFQVAQPMSVRNELAAGTALRTLAPFLLLLPALGLLIWFTVGRGLRPLDAMAHAVEARTPAALHPLPERGLPEEIQPLATALNDLLRRLDRALVAQRQFVADAAHELRTPLTALGLQIQLAERAATPEERAVAFVTVKEGLARAAHLVRQLLTLARQEPDAAQRPFAAVDLVDVSRQVIADHAPLATAKGIDLGLARADAASVDGDREGLRVLLANLVDNAIRYTPQQGRVDLSVYISDEGPIVEVADNGPGIPVEDRARVFDRFYRGESADIPGSGLGLAIVKNVADRHQARVVLADGAGGQGLTVRVVFPRK